MSDDKILIIIPAYNEEKAIGQVISDVYRHLPQATVLVVNDGSRDNTGIAAFQSGARVIDLPHNLGIGGAVQTGYRFAAKNGFDIAVQLDGDGQHPAAELPKLIEPILKKRTNFVIGSRYVQETSYQSTAMRRMGMIVFAKVVSAITKQRFTDTTSGFRAADRGVIKYFSSYYPIDYPEVEAIVLLKKAGFNISEISVEMRERQGGTSSITPLKSIYYLVKVLLALFINVLRSSKKGVAHGLGG